MRTLQWPFPPNINSLPPCYAFPGGTWALPPASACSYGLISPLSSQKEDTMYTLVLKIYLFFLTFLFHLFSQALVSMKLSTPRSSKTPHTAFHTTCLSCLPTGQTVDQSSPLVMFLGPSIAFCALPFHSIPFIPPTPSTAPQALTWPLLFLWVTSLDVLSQCPPAMPHPQMLLCLRA